MSSYKFGSQRSVTGSLLFLLAGSVLVVSNTPMAISAEGELIRDSIPFTVSVGPISTTGASETVESTSITDQLVRSTLGESVTKTEKTKESQVVESTIRTEKTAEVTPTEPSLKTDNVADSTVFGPSVNADSAALLKSGSTDAVKSDSKVADSSKSPIKDAGVAAADNSNIGTASPNLGQDQVQGSEPVYRTGIKIDATVNAAPIKNPAQQIDEITNQAVANDSSHDVSNGRRFFRKLGDMAQYATTCKGFHSSSEGADLILSEKEKQMMKNATSLEYVKQRRYDGLHTQIAGCVFQIALGLGAESNRKDQCVNSAYVKLKDLIGEEKAQSLVNSLTAWSDQVKSENRKFDVDTLDILSIQNKSTQVVTTALENDDVVKTIKVKLHKYNTHSKLSQISNKVINTSLSLAALTPTFVSPAAQFTQFCYIAATGGPEESKLLKELYLDRRLEERFRRLNQETNLALTNYNIAVLTKNATLLGCCESVIKNMVGEESAAAVLPSTSSQLAAAN